MTLGQAVLAAAVAGLVSLVGCAARSHPSSGGEPAPIEIGAIYPLSGPQGAGGLSEERGVELAAEYVNQHGGVHGHPIALESVDVPTAEAVPSAMAELQTRHIQIFVGSHGSTMSTVAAQVAQQRQLLLWETGAVGIST